MKLICIKRKINFTKEYTKMYIKKEIIWGKIGIRGGDKGGL